MSELKQLCTFTLDDKLFGIEVRRVQEVLRGRDMTRVTLAARYIRGLINLRGQIVMAVDLRRCLDMSEPLIDSAPMNLVIRTEDGPISFLVDQIHDVVEVPADSFEPPTPNLRGPIRRLIRGTFLLDRRLLLNLDPDAVLELLDEASDGRGDP